MTTLILQGGKINEKYLCGVFLQRLTMVRKNIFISDFVENQESKRIRI